MPAPGAPIRDHGGVPARDAVVKYLQITKTSFLNRSYYRFELLFDALKGIVMVLVIAAIWRAIYSDREVLGGYTLPQMVLYTCAATLISLVFNIDIAHFISQRIRRGDIAIELIRPLDYFLYCLSDHLGWAIYTLVFAAVPTCLALALLFDLRGALSANLPAAGAMTVLGFLVYYLFSHVCALSTFYTVDAWGVEFFRINLVRFFAGGFLPVSLFPEPLATISDLLPFKYMIYAPANALTGNVTGPGTGDTIAMQLLWIAVLLVIDRVAWRIVIRKVTIHGG
jgi:ABC-2 type transport system permease protein